MEGLPAYSGPILRRHHLTAAVSLGLMGVREERPRPRPPDRARRRRAPRPVWRRLRPSHRNRRWRDFIERTRAIAAPLPSRFPLPYTTEIQILEQARAPRQRA